MIGIITALGLQDAQDRLKTATNGQDISFLCDDKDNSVSLITSIEEHLNELDVIVIYTHSIRDYQSILPEIRKMTSTARIILILSGKRSHYVSEQLKVFRDYCVKEDILYDTRNDLNFNLLTRLSKGRLTKEDRFDDESKADILDTPKNKKDKDKPKEVKKPVKEEPPRESTEQETDAKPEPVAEPEQKPEPKRAPEPKTVPEAKPKAVKEKRSKLLRLPKINKSERGCYTIAVFGTTRGAGVTNMVYTLAEFLSFNGKRVLAVNLTGGTEFDYIRGNADYINSTLAFARQNEADYDIVIYDIGTPLNISEKGLFCGLSDDYARGNVELLKRCSIKIGMAFGDAWHIRKCEYFLTSDEWKKLVSNDYIFLFDRDITKEMHSRYPEINIYNRNDTAFSNTIERLFLMEGR